MKQVDRRAFLKMADGMIAGATLTASVPPLIETATGLMGPRPTPGASPLPYLFTLGVASGDPLPDSVVLWTRLAPHPQEPGGGMPHQVIPVYWEVATDDQFRRIVRMGQARARPQEAHSVHVEVHSLSPARP